MNGEMSSTGEMVVNKCSIKGLLLEYYSPLTHQVQWQELGNKPSVHNIGQTEVEIKVENI